MNSGGFVDLRIDQYDDNNNEGFWPSFTDIMTVIVMIFLLSMVVLMMRNMELVNQLRNSIEAEREAAEIAQAKAMETHSLDEKLSDSEAELAILRYRLAEANEEVRQYQNTQLEQNLMIEQLNISRQMHEENMARLAQDNADILQNLASANYQLTDLETQSATLNQKHQAQKQRLAALETERRTQAQAMQALKAASQHRESVQNRLNQDYVTLKSKYEKLIKPARTSKGKVVVQVFHRKVGTEHVYKVKLPGAQTQVEVSKTQLHEHLSTLKQRYPDKLYIKITFPENSGLSHSEAWKFTNQMLVQYDSYYNKNH